MFITSILVEIHSFKNMYLISIPCHDFGANDNTVSEPD